MKTIRIFFAVAALLTTSSFAFAQNYQVTINKVGNNMYKDSLSGFLIKTSLCLEYAYSDDAILVWNYPMPGEFSYGGKLIFSDGDSCDVMAIY